MHRENKKRRIAINILLTVRIVIFVKQIVEQKTVERKTGQ